MTVDVVDLFAGPGGWDEGLTTLGYDGTVVGVEWDHDACRTAAAAGHLRIEADVADYPPDAFADVDGLIASPPCQAFSDAGKRAGVDAIPALLAHVRDCADGWIPPPSALCAEDLRADLTLQPLRWADALRPRWIACEQVRGVLPLWEEIARVLEGWGYSTWTGILCAADYGVPQTRHRAILIARNDGIASPPEPTHTEHATSTLFGELSPWVTMAQALGLTDGPSPRPAPTVTGGGPPTGSPEPFASAHSRRAAARAVALDDAAGRGAGMTERHGPREPKLLDGPAPTVTTKVKDWRYVAAGRTGEGRPKDPTRHPADTVTGKGTAYWVRNNPAPTVVTSRRSVEGGIIGRNATDGYRVSVVEAGILQSFRADYPWVGSKSSRFQQVGNAIPPPLAAAVLDALVR